MNMKALIILLTLWCPFLMPTRSSDLIQQNLPREKLEPKFPFDGRIVFQSNFDGDNEIFMMTQEGIQKLTDNTWEDKYPVWSPDGKTIAYTANPKGNYDIFTIRPDGSSIEQITSSQHDESDPAWLPSGKGLIFAKETPSFARKKVRLLQVDLSTKREKKVMPRYTKTAALAHVSPSGSQIVFTGKRLRGWDVAVFNRHTNKVQFLDKGGKSCRARFSKSGKKLAYVSSSADGKGDIWLMNPDGTQKTRLTLRNDTYDYFPSWSPDERYIVFNSSRQHDHDGDWALYLIEVKSKKVILLFDSPGNDVFADWH